MFILYISHKFAVCSCWKYRSIDFHVPETISDFISSQNLIIPKHTFYHIHS